jgi:UDP-N-acetylglucosamine--N-acetylmuramyl-(pentapeptide) pyrophosphoryl-undecaprenol N-acetylglucosamine transferase
VRFVFVGGQRGLEGRLIPEAGIEFHATSMPSLRDPDSRRSLLKAALVIPQAVLQASWIIFRTRPRAILTAGGLVSLPVALAATIWRVPVVLWDGDAVPGRVNRLLARFARSVAVTFPEEAEYFPRAKVMVTGNPIRGELLRWTRADARKRLDLPDEGLVVLASGGSQGSEAVNTALLAALPRILPHAHVLHLAGDAHVARCEARRERLAPELRDRYRPYGFLKDEMGAALAAADLVVGRAGSSTIYEALAMGRPLVLVPFEAAASGHQLANARSAVSAGAAALIREGELDGDRLVAVVAGLLSDRERLSRMQLAAARAGRPDAASAIARKVLEHARAGTLPKPERSMAEPRG